MNMLAVLRNIVINLLALAAKIEFHIWADNQRRTQYLRKLQLWIMRINFGKKFYCGPDIYIRNYGNMEIGERCSLGFSSQIWNYAPIRIGEDFMAAAGLKINTGGHDVETMRSTTGSIRIGDRCWCGLNVTILAGVTIGNDVVIAAGSVVINDIPDSVIVAGIPAKVIRQIARNLDAFDKSSWR